MLRSPIEEGAEPYWYARVLGVFHVNIWAENLVIPGARNVRRMDFLWVRWFGEVPCYRLGFHQARLPKIGFVESTDEFAFSFVDPANVVHGCHLIRGLYSPPPIPHGLCTESEDCPRTPHGLNSDFFWLKLQPNLKIRV